jgi:hypothetical protein
VIVTMKGSLFPWFCSKQTTIISIECKSSWRRGNLDPWSRQLNLP